MRWGSVPSYVGVAHHFHLLWITSPPSTRDQITSRYWRTHHFLLLENTSLLASREHITSLSPSLFPSPFSLSLSLLPPIYFPFFPLSHSLSPIPSLLPSYLISLSLPHSLSLLLSIFPLSRYLSLPPPSLYPLPQSLCLYWSLHPPLYISLSHTSPSSLSLFLPSLSLSLSLCSSLPPCSLCLSLSLCL
jgi:hypothetical protein